MPRAGVVAGGGAVVLTLAAYAASLTWILSFVREIGAEWMQHLAGRIG